MQFSVKKSGANLLSVMRRAGYRPAYAKTSAGRSDPPNRDEKSFLRPLAGQTYPRFHIYVAEENNVWIFKLHLDQKKPSYQGTAAHAGEYAGPVVEQEAARIREALSELD